MHRLANRIDIKKSQAARKLPDPFVIKRISDFVYGMPSLFSREAFDADFFQKSDPDR